MTKTEEFEKFLNKNSVLDSESIANTWYELKDTILEYENLFCIIETLNRLDIEFWTHAYPDKKIHININANDLFYWGTSDCEETRVEDLPDLMQAFHDLNEVGLDGELYCDLLWMVRKRKLRPQGACFSRYPHELQSLIIQSAPPRDIDLCNPYSESGSYDYRPKQPNQ